MTHDQIQTLAHRMCFRYAHSPDAAFAQYTFGKLTLIQFAARLRAAALEEAAAVCDDTLKAIEDRVSALDAGVLLHIAAQIRAKKEA